MKRAFLSGWGAALLGKGGIMRSLTTTAAPVLTCFNPADGTVSREVPMDTYDTVRIKYGKARQAQKEWCKVPLEERMEVLKAFSGLLEQRGDTLAEVLTLDMGKPIEQAKAEISFTRRRIAFFLEHTAKVCAPCTVKGDETKGEVITYEPLGVVANISAWNYPYFVGSNVFIPALLTGNAVLYKPSEYAVGTGLAIRDLLHESGVPQDVFATAIGTGDVGRMVMMQAVDGVFFTGSMATGKKIAEAVGRRMIKMQLELGGKDPTYVCDDADLEEAATALADGAMYNAGQGCCSVERIYVHKKVYDAFMETFLKEVRAFKVGTPSNPSTYIGPLARKSQLSVLEEQVNDAVKKGAKLECGGRRIANNTGFYFSPTVLSAVNHSMDVMHEESFGPIIGIQSVQNDADAIILMNDTKYGLTAGVFTKNPMRARAILSEVDAATVYRNCCDRVSPSLPWSGRKHSGIGVTLGEDGIRTFLRHKAWHLQP